MKTKISNLVHTLYFWNNLHQVAKYFQGFGRIKTKDPKHDNQNQLRLPNKW